MFIKQEPAAPSGSRKRMLPVSTTHLQPRTKKSVALSAAVAAKEDKSVKLLQSLWRRKYRFNQTHQVVDTFLEIGPTAHRVKSIR